jgi:hypothetical protein
MDHPAWLQEADCTPYRILTAGHKLVDSLIYDQPCGGVDFYSHSDPKIQEKHGGGFCLKLTLLHRRVKLSIVQLMRNHNNPERALTGQ